jgi:sterol 14alpha-demethylase
VDELRTPPPVAGLPVLGNLWEYFRYPEPLLRRGYRELGPIFSLRLGPRRAAVLIGPDYHRFFFLETDRCLSLAATFQWLTPMFGNRFPLALQGRPHLTDRPVLQRALKGQWLVTYADDFIEQTKRWLDTLADRGEFELIETFRRLTLLNATRLFLGHETCDGREEEVMGLIDDIALGASDHAFRRFWVQLPRVKRFRSKRRLHEIARQTIDQRRSIGSCRVDYLQALMEASTESGPIPEADIINLAAGMIWGGHATLWGHLSWALIQLLQHPDYLQTVMQEQRKVFGPAGGMRPDKLAELHHLDWALRETERMRPPVIVMGRLTVESYELGGYRVPRGWLTLLAPPVAHRLPEIFSDPDSYDPYRFGPGRQEDKRHPYGLIGFGRGTHRCIGEDLAMLEMKLILSMLLQRFHLKLKHPGPERKAGPDPNRPKAPVTIGYEKR